MAAFQAAKEGVACAVGRYGDEQTPLWRAANSGTCARRRCCWPGCGGEEEEGRGGRGGGGRKGEEDGGCGFRAEE